MRDDELDRRRVLAGAAALAVAPLMTAPALAQTPKGRIALPGGGDIAMPSPYRVDTKYPNYAKPEWDVRIGYRNWRSTMSGHPDCDGLIAVGRTERFASLRDFVSAGRAGASIAWRAADIVPGTTWSANEQRFEEVETQGPGGLERTSQLAVHRSGFFDVYDEPARLCAVQHASGVSVAVWIFDKHGGEKKARRLIDGVGKSFRS